MALVQHYFVHIAAITDYLLEGNNDVHYGCEVDQDSIVDLPSSAKTAVRGNLLGAGLPVCPADLHQAAAALPTSIGVHTALRGTG